MKKIIIIFMIAVSILIISITSIAADTTSSVVKIGVLAPLTGVTAADGEEMLRGAELAVKEINADGGINGFTFEIVKGDTESQTTSAVTNAINYLVSKGVDCIVTGYASTSNFEIEQMADLNMPYILSAQSAQTRAIVSKNPEKYNTVWSFMPSYDGYGTVPAEFFEKGSEAGYINVGNRRLAIVSSDCEYSYTIYVAMKEEFSKLGWTIVYDEVVPFVDIYDWSVVLKKIRDTNPDLVINTDYIPGNSATFLNQFLQNPTNSYVFLQYAPSVPEFMELTKEKSTGVLYTNFSSLVYSPDSQETMEFLEKFKEEYGVETGSYGHQLYEEVYLYVEALKKVGDPKDHTAVGIAIGETDKKIPSGRLKFDPQTHLAIQAEDYFPLQFYQLWEGKRIIISPERFATGEFQTPPWMKNK